MARNTRSGDNNTGGAGQSTGGAEFVDPSSIAGSSDEITIDGDSANIGAEPRRQRSGRKPRTQKTASLDLKGIEGILLSAHWMISAAVKVPELRLSEPEAHGLAVAMQNVARHYPTVKATQQTLDWVALIVCCATLYGTKFGAYSARVKRGKQPGGVRGDTPTVVTGLFPIPPGTA